MKFRKIVANILTTDFRKACEIVTATVPQLGGKDVLVKARYAGINATDINVTAGRYGKQPVPFDVGLEGVGEITDVGNDIPKTMIGQAVGYIWNGSFSEYIKIPANKCIPLPDIKAEYVPLMISGLTASIGLHEVARMAKGETVLITAAAGGTGHIAVQIAKEAGCHVIGTCSNDEKSKFLKSIGCDHVINYQTEDLKEVLKLNYPRGIDVVYESIGGKIFETCLNRLAIGGRMLVIGYINSYHSPAGIDRAHRDSTMVTKLMLKSATVSGFFLMNHREHYAEHLQKQVAMLNDGRLKVLVDQGDNEGMRFNGLDSVCDAIDHLYSRKSKGKVIVDIEGTAQAKL